MKRVPTSLSRHQNLATRVRPGPLSLWFVAAPVRDVGRGISVIRDPWLLATSGFACAIHPVVADG